MPEVVRWERRVKRPDGGQAERAVLVGARAVASGRRGATFLLGSLVLHAALGLVLVWFTGVFLPAAEPPIVVHMIKELHEEVPPGTPKVVEALEPPPSLHDMPRPLPLDEPSDVLPPDHLEVLLPPPDALPDTPPPRHPSRISLEQHVETHAPSAELTLLPPVEGGEEDDFAIRAEELIREAALTGRALQQVGPERYAALPPARSRGSEARYRTNPKPQYPRLARERGYEGDVLLKVLVLHDGTVGDISVHDSSGYEVLDMAALRAVEKWLFVPATRDGVPVARWAIVPVKFRLPR